MTLSSSQASEKLDPATHATYSSAIARLPLTMRPGPSQKLNQWDNLFPFERRQLTDFLRGLAQFSPAQLEELVQPLRALEARMGVEHWSFSASADTVENASLLARSLYFAEWRQQVDRIFAAIEQAAKESAQPMPPEHRVVLLVLPESLPIAAIAAHKPWDARGVEFVLDGDPRKVSELALGSAAGLPATLAAQSGAALDSDCWLIDAGASLSRFLPSTYPPVSLLEYSTLASFRDSFLAQINTIPKDIHGADQVLAQMRQQDWSAQWPAALAGQDRLRNFVVDLFFSGNGALIFSNAFVEWAASEAMRRARPRLMMCRFGMRSKPKPFTSIAIFENQHTISALRDEDDPQGSATDALILARYVWLSAARHPEGAQTSLVCVAESSRTAYVIAPDDHRPSWTAMSRVTPEALVEWMRQRLRA